MKDDGLAAGKGVVVTDDLAKARAHAIACDRVVIEEFLDGPEVSLFAITDGETVVPLQPAQDFKRWTATRALNTGGMAYSPLPWADPKLVEEVMETVLQPTVDELRRRGTPFSGLLYAGLAITSRGVRVIEFNARFGDPETQAVLARLKTPLAGVLLAAAEGTLADLAPLRWSDDAAVTVVVASHNYPDTPRTGDPITGLDEVAALDAPHAYVLHAGTKHDGDAVVSAGGRVLSVTATGTDLTRPAPAPTRRSPASASTVRSTVRTSRRRRRRTPRPTSRPRRRAPGWRCSAHPRVHPPGPRILYGSGPDPCPTVIHLSPKPFHRVSDAPSG